MSGYELKKITEQTIVHFWTFNFSQIYPALKILHKEGLIEKKTKNRGDKEKYIYNITLSGKEKGSVGFPVIFMQTPDIP
jgi:DNA-binding PadR family transcriptional regulator